MGKCVHSNFLSVQPSIAAVSASIKQEERFQDINWLGYWLMPEGLKLWKKRNGAVLHMQPPASVKQVRSFIGAVSY
jgi:hypothetical protein